MASNGNRRITQGQASRRRGRSGGETTRWLKELPTWFWTLSAFMVLLHVALIALGGYGWGIISRLRLPISTWVSSLAVILPLGNLAATAHALIQSSGHARPLKHIRWNLFVTVLTILDAVLVTLAATHISKEGLACPLEQEWKGMFKRHDAEGIRAIQDALNCCGFKSVVDMPYPFPSGEKGSEKLKLCSVLNKRDTSCFEPWREKEQVASSLYVVVGAVLGLVKVLSMIYLNRKTLINPDHRSSSLAEDRVRFAEASDTEDIDRDEPNGANRNRNGSYGASRRQIVGLPDETTNLLDDSDYDQQTHDQSGVV